jgi:hypothetical protein
MSYNASELREIPNLRLLVMVCANMKKQAAVYTTTTLTRPDFPNATFSLSSVK